MNPEVERKEDRKTRRGWCSALLQSAVHRVKEQPAKTRRNRSADAAWMTLGRVEP